MNVKVYVIYHDDESRKKVEQLEIYPQIELIQVEQSKYFESDIFRLMRKREIDWKYLDYVGIITYKIFELLPGFKFSDLLKEIAGDYDVYSLFNSKNDKLLKQAEKYHPGFSIRWNNLLVQLGYQSESVAVDPTVIFFRNWWVAKSSLVLSYIDLVEKIRNILDDPNEPLYSSFYDNSRYSGNITSEKLKMMCHRPHYTFHAFILERLPCWFFHISGATVKKSSLGRSI